MIQGVYLYVILVAGIIIANLADSATTRNIYKPPGESDLSEIEDSTIPWVMPDLIPTIEEFKKNLFEDLQSSPQIQNIWNFETDSRTTRDIFFKLLNKYLSDIRHPAPSALANVVSKSGSLFDPMTMPIIFKTKAIHLAEFLLSHNIEIDRSTSQRYVDCMSSELDKADLNDPESIWQALVNGYASLFESFGFNLADIVDELLEGLASQFIVMYDNLNGLP